MISRQQPRTRIFAATAVAAIIMIIMTLITGMVGAVRFSLRPDQRKCLKNEMYPNQLAVGDYEVSSHPGSLLDLEITDSRGHIALRRENIEARGKFAVTSDNYDFYELCFIGTLSPGFNPALLADLEISVDYRVGVEAKSYEQDEGLAAVDMMSEFEKDLRRVEDLTNGIIIDFAYLKKRGQEMRNTNESTNNRLFYQTLTSVIILLVLTGWQILYLRTFFRARKLID